MCVEEASRREEEGGGVGRRRRRRRRNSLQIGFIVYIMFKHFPTSFYYVFSAFLVGLSGTLNSGTSGTLNSMKVIP